MSNPKKKAKARVTTGARKPAAKPKSSPKAANADTKARPRAARPTQANKKETVVLLSGGNPQIPRGEGDGPVKAYIAAMPEWKRATGQQLDAIIERNVPGVQKAVKWNSPFYGVEGKGWFLSFHVFARYVKVTFFRGTSLRPIPPGSSKHPEVRYLDIHEGALDEPQLTRWVKQAAALPGWIP